MKTKIILSLALLFATFSGSAQAGQTLNAVKKKGYVQCGVNTGVTGFASLNSKGIWEGIDVDVCRAVAAAVFGDAKKVKFTPLNTQQRFTALQSGEIDLLARNTTETLSRDTALGFNFTAVNYYDGQGFMVPKSLGVKSAKDLEGATVCMQPGTTTEKNLSDYFRANKMKFKPLVMEDMPSLRAAFFAGRCDVYTTDRSGLAVLRSQAKNPANYQILPDTISKEPLSPLVRHGDDEWLDVIRWSQYAMINAEELGVTSKNVDDMAKSTNPKIKRLLGVIPDAGKALGLNPKWAHNIIKQVGNYGESFERNVGANSPLKLDRGLNKLWTQGGILYAPPIR